MSPGVSQASSPANLDSLEALDDRDAARFIDRDAGVTNARFHRTGPALRLLPWLIERLWPLAGSSEPMWT
jgi:hypothetical protein